MVTVFTVQTRADALQLREELWLQGADGWGWRRVVQLYEPGDGSVVVWFEGLADPVYFHEDDELPVKHWLD